MKTIGKNPVIAIIAIVCLSLNLQAAPIARSLADTSKKSKMKMDKMDKMSKMDSKMDKKMDKKKMSKDTGKMSKMSKM
jgi:hypothetical protein